MTVNEPGAEVTVTSIIPNSVLAGDSVDVTINGSNFAAGASVTFENDKGSSPTASNIIVVDANTITATVTVKANGPSGNHLFDVRVTNNTDATTGVLVDGFTVIR